MHLLHVWDSEKYFMCSNSELNENVPLKRAMRYTTDWNFGRFGDQRVAISSPAIAD